MNLEPEDDIDRLLRRLAAAPLPGDFRARTLARARRAARRRLLWGLADLLALGLLALFGFSPGWSLFSADIIEALAELVPWLPLANLAHALAPCIPHEGQAAAVAGAGMAGAALGSILNNNDRVTQGPRPHPGGFSGDAALTRIRGRPPLRIMAVRAIIPPALFPACLRTIDQAVQHPDSSG